MRYYCSMHWLYMSIYNLTIKENKNQIMHYLKKKEESFRYLRFMKPNLGKITCELLFVAPMSTKIISQEFNKTKDYNSMSIIFALSLNKINYLFCGDVENTTLNHMVITIQRISKGV